MLSAVIAAHKDYSVDVRVYEGELVEPNETHHLIAHAENGWGVEYRPVGEKESLKKDFLSTANQLKLDSHIITFIAGMRKEEVSFTI